VPSAVISRLVAGDQDAVLDGPDLWQCVDCMTCFERCHSRLGMAEVFESLKRLARERGAIPTAVRTNYEAFLSNGVLGAGRPAVRDKLGLPETPANGLDDLKKLLAEKVLDASGDNGSRP
jgi:heterodisulfide reductase subunit C